MNSNQTAAVISALLVNTDLEGIDYALLKDRVKTDPQGMGRDFVRFLKAGARMPLGELKIATSPFDVSEFVGRNWKVVADEQDKRSEALSEVDFSRVEFPTCLVGNETSIKGEEKFLRLKKDEGKIRYGGTVFMGLWLDYQTKKENSVLERLYREKGITYLDFFGDILLNSNDGRYVLYLYRNVDGSCRWNCFWLGDVWLAGHVSAVSPQV